MEGFKSFVSGGIGGMTLTLVGYPLDTIKVQLQTAAPGKFTGTMDCAKQTLARDGFFGLYRGVAAPLLGISPTFAVYFWGFDKGKDIARSIEGKGPDETLSVAGTCFAGGFSAIPGTAAMVPSDRIKVIMQMQVTEGGGKYNGPLDAAVGIFKEDGIRGLYKGTNATLLRDIPGSIAYYAAYELIKDAIPGGADNVGKILFAGGMAGVCNWLVAVPMDTVKSRFQSAPEGTFPGGLKQVTTELIKKEGVASLYKGLAPALLRAFPANAACFLGMEVSKKAMTALGI